jgi:hypothetical protein
MDQSPDNEELKRLLLATFTAAGNVVRCRKKKGKAGIGYARRNLSLRAEILAEALAARLELPPAK